MPPQVGFIHLILSPEHQFYLEIPVNIITESCLQPLKYLRYIAWCVLGVVGVLQDGEGNAVQLDGGLIEQGVYRYAIPDNEHVLAHMVDLEVIKQRTNVPLTSSTGTREDFRQTLLPRDSYCVWTGATAPIGMHIIPWAQGDEWFQQIVANRSQENENAIAPPLSINDIRNGIAASPNIYTHFDPRSVVVLKTPNPILESDDIPRHQRVPRDNTTYPTNSRYTLQWIVTGDPVDRQLFPNNNDAAFRDHNLLKPADILLHYNYGAAAVKHWCNHENLKTLLKNHPACPKIPEKTDIGPSQSIHDRNITIEKCNKRRQEEEEGGGGSKSKRRVKGSRAMSETPMEFDEDEDDVMLFFWGNTKAARERRAKQEQDFRSRLEEWRSNVLS